MNPERRTNLRVRLREALHGEHDALDAAVSSFDFKTASGRIGFLRVQEAGMAQLSGVRCAAATKAAIMDLLARARADLEALAITPLKSVPTPLACVHPLAVDYVVGGSRLGTVVLKDRWLSAVEGPTSDHSAYFSAPSYSEIWREFRRTAQTLPAMGEEADRIVEDAACIFRVFADCAARAKQEEADHNVAA